MEVMKATNGAKFLPMANHKDKGKIQVTFSRTYHMKYIGCGVLDRCFTQPMLPWIISDIRRKGLKDAERVILEVTSASLRATNVSNGSILFEHKFESICKFTHIPHDRNCFTYLTRDVLEAPFMCHVFHAMDEAMVLELFATMRDMTKGVAPLLTRMGTSFGVDAFAGGSQHFEVLYVGKIKVSQKRAPLSFVDEALEKFRQVEQERSAQGRRRHGSGSSVSSLPGPGTPSDLCRTSTTIPENQLQMQMSGSTASVDMDSGLEVSSVCRLGSSEALSPASPEGSLQSLVTHTRSMDTDTRESLLSDLKQINNNNNALAPPTDFVMHSQSLDTNSKNSLLQDLLHSSDHQRVRSCSGDVPRGGACKQVSLPLYSRSRVGSGGPLDLRRPKRTPEDQQQPHLSRAMLLLIGKLDLCLIGTDMKQVMLNKTFSDISHCCKGVQHSDNFGFICREVSLTQTDSYVGYIFRCQTKQVVDEIMQTLKQAFNSAHQAYQRQQSIRGQLQLCETCPMHWFHRLSIDLEGLPPDKMHLIILRRMKSLSEPEQEDVMLKYQGAEVSSTQEQNEIFMMLLRGICEHKQVRHTHSQSENKIDTLYQLYTTITNSGLLHKKAVTNCSILQSKHIATYTNIEKRPTTASKLDNLKQKAKKSLSNSFDSILKKRSKEDLREKSLSDAESLLRLSQTGSFDGSSPENSPFPSPGGKREGSYEFPDRKLTNSPPPRPRSSTFGSAGDVIKKVNGNDGKSPIMNIFMKVGNQNRSSLSSKRTLPSQKGPWRQAIFRRVQAPIQQALRPDSKGDKPDSVTGFGVTKSIPRSSTDLRRLWKKAIMEQILLIRMDKENRKLQVNQDAASYKRMKLDYEEITTCLKESSLRWETYLNGPGRPNAESNTRDLKDLVRAGVPRHERGEIWLFLSEQFCLHNPVACSSPDGSEAPYGYLLKKLTPHQHAILIDLGRTFPSHPFFAQPLGPGQLSLFNLLKAYSLLDTEVGYCQGLSFVAGVLLLHMPEENAFHLLKHIHFRMGFRKQYRPDMVALQVQMYQLSRLIHDVYPEIYSHFEQYEIAPTLYAAPWFLTLFASQFTLGFVARLFDVLFLSGMEAVFKVALVLLGEHQEAILAHSSFESVMEFLKTALPSMGIIQMERVFSQVFSLDVGRQLQAYEVEYYLLQEEMQYSVSSNACKPDQTEALTKLETANRNLKRQNMELNDQLQVSQSTVYNLETSVQTYQSTVKHLEARVRTLEDERDALLHSVNAMRKRLDRMERQNSESVLSTSIIASETPEVNENLNLVEENADVEQPEA